MSHFLSVHSAKRILLALTVAVALPVGLGISGCSDAPKLAKRDEPAQTSKPAAPAPTGGADTETENLPKPTSPPKKVDTVPVDKSGRVETEEKYGGSASEPRSSDAEPGILDDEKGPAAGSPPAGGSAPGAGGAPTAPPPGAPTRSVEPAPVPPPPPKTAEKPASADDRYDVVPVYYGTDRAVQADPKRLQYGSERGHKLQLGRALITVPKAHKVPDIERPWVVEIPYFKVKIYEEAEDPNKHFTIQEISTLTKEQLLALVKERLAKSKTFKDHAFIFVHGFNTSFDYALFRTAQISYDMKFDGAPFVYSWPSGGKVASYTYDRGSAEQAEPHLAEFINLVVKETGAKSISLIAHSMGNELLLRVLERLRPAVPEGVVISQVILAAPDVDRDKFDNIARAITDFSKGVTLYASSNDRALSYSARFWGGIPRAGDVPATGPMIVPGVDTIDVTAVSTDSLGLNHSGYAENNALLADIALLLLQGVRPPDKRLPTMLKLSTASGGAYWKFPPPK